MADSYARTDELAQPRTQLVAQQAQINGLLVERRHPRRHYARRFLPVILVALLPLSLLAAGPTFNDLNPNSVHNGNIQAIADAGITKGCDPGVSYCPNGLVTREEMASFLARSAGLGDNAPVTNAKTATNATNAGNANTVGGYAPNSLLRTARSQPTSAYLPLNRNGISVNSVTLTPPGPGFVLITATVLFYVDPDGGRVNYVEAWLQDTGATGAASQSPRWFRGLAARIAYAYADGGTISWVFPVSGTAPRTFQVLARQQFDPDVANYAQAYFTGDSGFGGTVTALFVPFAQDGGTTLTP